MKNANATSETAEHKTRLDNTTELDDIVSRIGRASKALNSAASEATKRIEALEERLVAAEPGISVWGATLVSENATYRRGDGSLEVGQRIVTVGFDRVKKEKWGLAVREELRGKEGLIEEDISLLRKADRNLRLLALPHLVALARQILEALEARPLEARPLEARSLEARSLEAQSSPADGSRQVEAGHAGAVRSANAPDAATAA